MKNRVRKLLLVSVLATGLSVGPVVSRDAHALDLGDIQENPQEYAVYAGLGVLIIVGYTIKKVRDKKKAKKREEKAEKERIEREAAELEAKMANTTEDKDVKSIAASWPDDGAWQPGGSLPLTVTVTAQLPGGKELNTPGAGGGETPWSEFEFEVTGGSFRNGAIAVNGDPRTITDHTVTFTVTPIHHPDLVQTYSFPVSYDASYVDGNSGGSGDRGSSGNSGNRGNEGAEDLDGNGSVGGSGGGGGNGQAGSGGGHGHDVKVLVRAVEDPAMGTLLQVLSTDLNTGETGRYLVDPDGGTVTIVARGGNGGDGGSGGNGGQGGTGGKGAGGSSPSGSVSGAKGNGGDGGSGGNGGDGGNGANGGNGGRITIHIDPSASAYADRIHTDNGAGNGGSAGFRGNAGSAGMGGSGYYSGSQGSQGSDGQYGQAGQAGQSGPAPTVKVEKVDLDW